ncbi:MAG TPA: superoxide dismutase [Candidatus Portnoybacteria bacterium]|nr:superoxide dismutase [Candidatus Portnoybacteria bacterium]
MKYELPKLNYTFNALEPSFDALTMEIHYGKHHQAYINKLNEALKDYPVEQNKSLEELLVSLDSVPEKIRLAVKNNGGGHFNHSFFWRVLAPTSGQVKGELARAINKKYGDFNSFKELFTQAAATFFGSGWVWLVVNNNELEIISLPNQDCPISQNQQPILAIDLWEHAYYLKYQNRRAEYIEAWWRVINWDEAEKNYKNI